MRRTRVFLRQPDSRKQAAELIAEVLLLVLLDQLLKQLLRSTVREEDYLPLLGNMAGIYLIQHRTLSFVVDLVPSLSGVFFWGLPGVLLSVCLFLWYRGAYLTFHRSTDTALWLCLSNLIAGNLSSTIDRWFLGGSWDFLMLGGTLVIDLKDFYLFLGIVQIVAYGCNFALTESRKRHKIAVIHINPTE